jgi:hypothetical protein
MFIIIPMCGGHDYAINMSDYGRRHINAVFFITDEGISTHPSEEHMNECLNYKGFSGCLEIKSRALPTANNILNETGLPEYFIKYLEAKIAKWS